MVKKTATALAALFAAACGSSSSTPDADGPPIAPDGGGGEYYLPPGTTLTPFLSDVAVHEFAAPGDALEDGKDYLAVLDTDQGVIVLELFEEDTPITVNSFVWLALHHYFDGIAFHRVIEGFVAQGGDPNTIAGDPSTWGTGGPGYGFGVEIVPGLSYDAPGVVGMARTADPNSNGSQFFITLAAQPQLDGDYTIFARVDEGLDVLPRLARGEPPSNPTRMTRGYIVER
jgi:peptidylprolyl isomerase